MKVEARLGLCLPTAYRELLLVTNGLEPRTNKDRYAIALFKLEELPEFQEAYAIPECIPGHILIGFDGGCRGLFLKADEQGPLFLSETSAYSVSELRMVADGLAQWVAQGFDLGDPTEEPSPERIDVHLLRAPIGGLKELRKICQKFEFQVPICELKELLRKLPTRIGHDLPFMPYGRLVREINSTDNCLGTSAVDAS